MTLPSPNGKCLIFFRFSFLMLCAILERFLIGSKIIYFWRYDYFKCFTGCILHAGYLLWFPAWYWFKIILTLPFNFLGIDPMMLTPPCLIWDWHVTLTGGLLEQRGLHNNKGVGFSIRVIQICLYKSTGWQASTWFIEFFHFTTINSTKIFPLIKTLFPVGSIFLTEKYWNILFYLYHSSGKPFIWPSFVRNDEFAKWRLCKEEVKCWLIIFDNIPP